MVATTTGRPAVRRRLKKPEIPPEFIHEIMDGKPLYRRGYLKVVKRKNGIDQIRGNSGLHCRQVGYLLGLLFSKLDDQKFIIAAGEPGLQINNWNILSTDLAIFSKSVLTSEMIGNDFAKVPPTVAIEFDTDIEFEHISSSLYIDLKTQKLLDFGVEKVVWFFTTSKKVLIARQNEDWLTRDWDKDVELMPGIVANLAKFLREKGIQF